MAIYRCEARIITRGKGHSAVAAAAYRTGTKIKDERAGITHNYSSRQKGIVESVILRPDNSPEWAANTATLWNEVGYNILLNVVAGCQPATVLCGRIAFAFAS